MQSISSLLILLAFGSPCALANPFSDLQDEVRSALDRIGITNEVWTEPDFCHYDDRYPKEFSFLDDQFQSDKILKLQLHLPHQSFEQLRNERIDKDADPQARFQYYTANITFGGETFSQLGIKKKGWRGSFSIEKPGFIIKANHVNFEARFPNGSKKWMFNNAVQDQSLLRQCLAYDVFERIGIKSPRCQFVDVWNGDEHLGIYVHIERIDAQFIKKQFGTKKGLFFESDLGVDFDAARNQFSLIRGSSQVFSSLMEQISSDLETDSWSSGFNLSQILDYTVGEFLTYHWDGWHESGNNTFYFQSEGKLVAIPSGVDQTWKGYRGNPFSWSQGSVLKKIKQDPVVYERFLSKLTVALEKISVPYLESRIQFYQSLIGPHLAHEKRDHQYRACRELLNRVRWYSRNLRDSVKNQ